MVVSTWAWLLTLYFDASLDDWPHKPTFGDLSRFIGKVSLRCYSRRSYGISGMHANLFDDWEEWNYFSNNISKFRSVSETRGKIMNRYWRLPRRVSFQVHDYILLCMPSLDFDEPCSRFGITGSAPTGIQNCGWGTPRKVAGQKGDLTVEIVFKL